MEILRSEDNVPDRVIAIHQTTTVVPNANYVLTIHALMRSDALAELRNQAFLRWPGVSTTAARVTMVTCSSGL